MADDPELDRMLGLAPAKEPGWWDTITGGALNALGYVGETFDKPGRAVRGVLGGQGADALKNLIPFSDTFELTDPKDSVTGEDLLVKAGLLDKQDEPSSLFSWRGLAGLGTEFLTDPTMILPGGAGLNALTKGGRAAQRVGGHLDEVARVAKAAAEGQELLRPGVLKTGATVADEEARLAKIFGGDVLERGPWAEGLVKPVSDEALLEGLQGTGSRLGQVAQDLTPDSLRLGETAADRVNKGQQAFLSVGGTEIPGTGLLGKAFGGTGEALRLPQVTLLEAPEAAQALSKVWGAINPTKVLPKAFGAISESMGMGRGEPSQEIQGAVEAAKADTQRSAAHTGSLIEEARKHAEAGDVVGAERKIREVISAHTGDPVQMFEGPLRELRPEVSGDVSKAINQSLEAGADPGHLAGLTNAIHQLTELAGKTDQEWLGVPLRENYATHAAHKAGLEALKNPAKRAAFVAEMEARGLPIGRGGSLVGKPGKELEDLLNSTGLTEEFLSEAAHGSTKGRKLGGTIAQINEAARAAGLGEQGLFRENPFEWLKVREMRHLKVKGQAAYIEGLAGLGLAQKGQAGAVLKAIPGNPYASMATLADGSTAYAANGIDPAKALFASAEDAAQAAKGAQAFSNPKVTSRLLLAFDKVSGWLRAGATKYFPAFHTRNRFSNRIQSFLEDVPMFGEHDTLAERFMAGKPISLKLGTGEVLDAAALERELADNGVVKQGFFHNQVAKAATDAADEAKQGLVSKVMGGIEGLAAAPAAAPGAILSGAPSNLLKASGERIEAVDRARHYIFKRMQGLSQKAAAESTNRALFDYSRSAYTPFENEFLRRAALFYSYNRNVIPFMIEKAATSTAKVAPWVRIANEQADQEWLPEWIKRQPNASLGENELGMPQVVAGFGTPLEAAAQPLQGLFGPSAGLGATARGVASQLNPLFRAPVELATGRDMFFGQDVAELNKAPQFTQSFSPELKEALGLRDIKNKQGQVMYQTANPWALWALRQTPFSRTAQTAGKVMDERRPFGSGAQALDLLTGMRVVSLDPEHEKAMAERNAQIELMRDLELQGRAREVRNMFTVTDPDDEEAKAELKALRMLGAR